MRSTRTSLALVALLATVACIHKTGGMVTPMERVTTDNALFAQLNNSVEKGAEAVANSGVLTPAQVAPVIAWTGQVATVHMQITAILKKGSAVSASDYTTLQALTVQIENSAVQLVNSGALNIKNPKSQQTISADISALSNLAQVLLHEISALTATPGPEVRQ